MATEKGSPYGLEYKRKRRCPTTSSANRENNLNAKKQNKRTPLKRNLTLENP
jgi:hypothetical protein